MREPKQRFVLNLKLKTQPYQEDVLDKRFEVGRKMYNALLGKSLKRYKEMTKTKRWRENQEELSKIYKSFKGDKKQLNKLCKPYYEIRNNMLQEYRLNEYSLHEDVNLCNIYLKII